MLPLRFPNSNIRGKQRLLGKEDVSHGHAFYKGDRPRQALYRGGRLQLGPLKGRQHVARLQGRRLPVTRPQGAPPDRNQRTRGDASPRPGHRSGALGQPVEGRP
ncbi:hypothetical protein B296_00005691 [Ensete ventricosum]|uniref:Uncharacterized protein n=1 Tax=Ensete ventricosum TaxID=4639 RepID=A0A426ZL92_ENSVE|nr:hypothetical protein B296_00005691 [Ensete ventricosum]